MNVAVCVPRRSDGARRDEVWQWVRAWWGREHPTFRIIEGHHDHGPFNRSAAINAAAAQAVDADVILIVDSDSFAGADQVNAAIDGLASGPSFWLPYTQYHYLNRQMSDLVMDGFDGDWLPGVEFTMTGTCSSVVVVTTDLFNEIGGFDERFEGWGFEDVAFSHAAQTFGSGLSRVDGGVWHLWHQPSPENNHQSPVWHSNRELMLQYGNAAYDRAAMRALIDER